MNNLHINMFRNYFGKETIDTNNYGKTVGHSGSYSTNYQIMGRELMTPDEVRLLDNKYALLFIRGERPIIDFKYNILKHPNVKDTVDGGNEIYLHGGTENSIASIRLENNTEKIEITELENIINLSEKYTILSEEELKEIIEKEIQNE